MEEGYKSTVWTNLSIFRINTTSSWYRPDPISTLYYRLIFSSKGFQKSEAVSLNIDLDNLGCLWIVVELNVNEFIESVV